MTGFVISAAHLIPSTERKTALLFPFVQCLKPLITLPLISIFCVLKYVFSLIYTTF